MDFDFGYSQNVNSNNTDSAGGTVDSSQKTDLSTGKIDHDSNGVAIDNIDDANNTDTNSKANTNNNTNSANQNNNNQSNSNNGAEGDDKNVNIDDEPLQAGTVIEIGEDKYTIDDNGNLIDKNNNIFKEAKDVKAWLKEFDKIENTDNEDISISAIQEAIGVEITDDKNNLIEYENTIDGIKSYINAVIETSKEEQQEAAINTLYQRYPIINDVLNYYIANGNSLEGFNEIPDRSNIEIDEDISFSNLFSSFSSCKNLHSIIFININFKVM